MNLFLITLLFLSSSIHAFRVAPEQPPAQQVMQRQMNALDLVANSRDRNGFNRILGAAEASRWGNPNNLFNTYQNRHITTQEAHYTNRQEISGHIRVSGQPEFAQRVWLSMDRNGPNGWKITGIINQDAVNRG